MVYKKMISNNDSNSVPVAVSVARVLFLRDNNRAAPQMAPSWCFCARRRVCCESAFFER